MPRPPKLDAKQIARLAQDIELGVSVPILAKTYGVTVQYVYKFKRDLEADKKLAAEGIEGAEAPRELKGKVMGSKTCATSFYRRDQLSRLQKKYPAKEFYQKQGDPQELLHSFEIYEGEQEKDFCDSECFLEYRDFVDMRMFPARSEGGKDTLCLEFREAILKRNERFFPESDFEDEELPDYLKS